MSARSQGAGNVVTSTQPGSSASPQGTDRPAAATRPHAALGRPRSLLVPLLLQPLATPLQHADGRRQQRMKILQRWPVAKIV